MTESQGENQQMRPFRFGVNLFGIDGDFTEQVRAVEATGADVLMVPDHLGFTAPFPALVAAGAVAQRMRLGHFVLNTGFYSPALLARDVAATDQFTGGRLEIGLGAGYAENEFVDAGIPFLPAGRRVDHLARTVRHLRETLSDPQYRPAPVQSPPPIMVAGVGDRVLTLAAQHADIIALSAIPDRATLADRVGFIKSVAGQRFAELELNLIIFGLAIDREPQLDGLRSLHPGAGDDELLASMNGLFGTLDEVTAQIRDLRESFGVSYFTIINPDGPTRADLAQLIAAVRPTESGADQAI
ncbi:TIGR03621 family F420-dependent LLM class oxidoreductase [Gordonia sp. L191]|uniref:TIGR03621 family F420-dependent LLM class oxidoreductase n=1 Tax=Gordonia sp. L191 TaxID=2982699 RepID=UPI0024C019EB|nr:TIGR03621 family F420-dependent LLM class oxidoreductase [Gordonia sp. L191]WHU46303.1 TIGR03621 family F420-dependent LLM class oxidoreductase [Gordonia sp. L191]